MKMAEAEKNERIKAVEEEIAKLQKELEDIRNSKVQEWDFGAWDEAPLRKGYKFDIPADSLSILLFTDKLDKLTKLMKFKFCYDYSYIPDWSNQNELKWYVYFQTANGKYMVYKTAVWDYSSMVYFSSQEIAQKCADWLNAGCPEE
jgi:hypothetical protein